MRQPSAAFVLAVVLAVSWIGFLASSPFAQEGEKSKPAVQQWEYKMLFVWGRTDERVSADNQRMNSLAAEGWELQTTSATTGIWVVQTFRRAK